MYARILAAAAALLFAAIPVGSVQAQSELSCRLDFSLSGWSVFYKTASGHGTVHCSNGQSMAVRIETRGGGLSLGRSRIDNGTGTFAGVKHINDVLGGYATAEAHAGLVRSAKAQVVTKGPVTLGLAGTGDGWDLGIAFGSFTISRR